MPKKYLFVCAANLQRSPWCARWFSNRCKEKGIEVIVKSAGWGVSDVDDYFGSQVKLTKEMIEEADKVFIMEDYMEDELKKIYGREQDIPEKITCLGIPDRFYSNLDVEYRDINTEKALEYIKKHKIFGPKVLSKVLELKLEKELKELEG